jgi:Zn-dependent membrane protease YugP
MSFQILFFIVMGASFLIQMLLKRRMEKYSNVVNPLGLTGKEIAEAMLRENGIYDVKVISTPGQLTDHYNPSDKTVNLSEMVYDSKSITAAAVSAHECGHAVQHATAYSMLGLRSRLVPIVNLSSKVMPILILAGFFLLKMSPLPLFSLPLFLGIILYGATTFFAFVTLPVEFDASKRALNWLEAKGLNGESYAMSKDGLKWAAMTYVLNAVASLINLLYYISILNKRN